MLTSHVHINLSVTFLSFQYKLVVTVDGILLAKSGTMTGGTSGGMEARSNKWDDKKVEGWFRLFCFLNSNFNFWVILDVALTACIL